MTDDNNDDNNSDKQGAPKAAAVQAEEAEARIQAQRDKVKAKAEEAASWSNWDDVELRTCLIRRGVDPVIAKGWVRDRQLTYVADEISAVIDRQYVDEDDEPIVFEIPQNRRARR